MGIEVKYVRIDLENIARLTSHPFGLDIKDFDEYIAFSDDLVCSDYYLNIGKDWQAIHFLLTGEAARDRTNTSPPLSNVVLGGTETEYQTDYGKVRYLKPNEVKEVVEALEQITLNDLRSHFSPEAFNAARIYPNPQPGGWTIEELESLLTTYVLLVEFFKEAAKQNNFIFISPG
ncbi:YfbM family protein [Myxosarcina sp. GI1]|uniref:YfbM family protein n=1 Tax=Myxosarcina sp. GI1 TaxID=1541065 RepID=UPI000564316C|nr:YfbM family protein [Myxosarcina sp. GI1]